jgi:flagellar basal body-associated protein FliL
MSTENTTNTPATNTKNAAPAATPQPTASTPAPGQPAASTATAAPAAKTEEPQKPSEKMQKLKGFGETVKKGLLGFLSLPLALFTGDWSTKLFLVGFLVGIALVGLTGKKLATQLIEKWRPKKVESAKKEGNSINQFLEDQKAFALAANNLVLINRFTVNLSLNEKNKAVQVVAFEFALDCNNPDTAQWVRNHVPLIRETISTGIQDLLYEPLMTEKGKEDLKSRLRELLNQTLEKSGVDGEIKQVFITQLVLS